MSWNFQKLKLGSTYISSLGLILYVCVCFSLLGPIRLLAPQGRNPPGPSVHRISQARKLEWIAISFSKGLSHPGTEPTSSALAGRFFTTKSQGKPGLIFWKPFKLTSVNSFSDESASSRFSASWRQLLLTSVFHSEEKILPLFLLLSPAWELCSFSFL